MKNKNYFLISCLMVVFTAFSVSAQNPDHSIDPTIKQKYENWIPIPGDISHSLSLSLKLDPAMDGSTMCKMNLKNSSSLCKHAKISFVYLNNNNNRFEKNLDVYVKPNGEIAPYYFSDKGLDYFYFNASKITNTFTVTLVEDSNLCK